MQGMSRVLPAPFDEMHVPDRETEAATGMILTIRSTRTMDDRDLSYLQAENDALRARIRLLTEQLAEQRLAPVWPAGIAVVSTTERKRP